MWFTWSLTFTHKTEPAHNEKARLDSSQPNRTSCAHFDANGLAINVDVLASECDRFEYLLIGHHQD